MIIFVHRSSQILDSHVQLFRERISSCKRKWWTIKGKRKSNLRWCTAILTLKSSDHETTSIHTGYVPNWNEMKSDANMGCSMTSGSSSETSFLPQASSSAFQYTDTIHLRCTWIRDFHMRSTYTVQCTYIPFKTNLKTDHDWCQYVTGASIETSSCLGLCHIPRHPQSTLYKMYFNSCNSLDCMH